MRKYFNPWGGIIIGSMLLFPYIFLGTKWSFDAYIIAIIMPLLVIYVIIEALKKRKDNKAPKE